MLKVQNLQLLALLVGTEHLKDVHLLHVLFLTGYLTSKWIIALRNQSNIINFLIELVIQIVELGFSCFDVKNESFSFSTTYYKPVFVIYFHVLDEADILFK